MVYQLIALHAAVLLSNLLRLAQDNAALATAATQDTRVDGLAKEATPRVGYGS